MVLADLGSSPWTALPGESPLAVRTVELLAGIALVGLGSGFYLAAALGPGPRDGLMTGLQRTTGRPVSLVRGCIEVSVLALGFLLGGVAGVGTLAFALLIGQPWRSACVSAASGGRASCSGHAWW